MKRNNKGFTLTEILIVLVVAGILLALILPNTLKAIERGRATQLRNDLHTIQVAAFMCFSATRLWASCDTLGELNAAAPNNYLDEIPTHPFGGVYSLVLDLNGTGGFVAATSAPGAGIVYPADITTDITNGVIHSSR